MKNKSLLIAVAVFLIVSGWYGSSVLSDLTSWNDWDKPAEVAKLWKAGIFGLVGMLLALGVDIKSLLGPFGQFLPGTTTVTETTIASTETKVTQAPPDSKG